MRNSKSVIYTSSYDRGLEHLLKIWGDVKKEVPEAELHIYYGWTLFEKFYKDNPSSMAWMARMNKMMEQPGITHHDRVSQDEMKKAVLNSGIWAYPTHFGEINCISAIKAQAWGAIPVVINYAALETTVQHGIKVDGDVYEPEVLEDYKLQLIKALKDEKWQEEIRPGMMKWAKEKFSWSSVAKQWSKEFKKE